MDIWFLFFRASSHERHSLFLFRDARLPVCLIAGFALPILQQGLRRHRCLGVFVVSHEECVALLLFQSGVSRVIRLPNKKAGAELFAGGCHRLLFLIGPNKDIHLCLVFSPMIQHELLLVCLYRRSWYPVCQPWDFTTSRNDLKIHSSSCLSASHIETLLRIQRTHQHTTS